MAASSTWTQPSLSNVACVSARCTGFAKVRGKNDFAFVVETEWSDQRKQCVKRTFDEFQVLHGCLTKAFPRDAKSAAADRKLFNLRSGIKDLFTQDRRRLAEIREPVVDAYLRDLTALPEKISRSSLVLTFLEPRDTDPKPVRAGGGELSEDGEHSWTAYRDWCVAAVLKSLQQSDSSSCATSGGGSRSPGTTADASARHPDVVAAAAHGDGSSPAADADENYFLNVGVQELMLLDSDSSSSQLDSMWCSDFEKFSEILRHNMGAFPLVAAPRRQLKPIKQQQQLFSGVAAAAAGEMTESSYQQSYDDDEFDAATAADECSDTESQRMERSYYMDNDVDGSDLESDDEFAAACDQGPWPPRATAPPHTNS